MNNEKMGSFISKRRKSRHLTQQELATQLNITDKAVSKWERGLSCPDISLLSSIAEILGVTTGELRNGEKNNADSVPVETTIDHAQQYAEKTTKRKADSIQTVCAIAFSALLAIGLAVCAICDLAISGAFTWSLFPISSIVFSWLVLFPIIKLGEKGIFVSMITLSVFLLPFLWVLHRLLPTSTLLLPIGIRMAVISIVFLWAVFALFRLLKNRKWLAASGAVLLAMPLYLLINLSLSRLIAEPFVDVWDVLSLLLLALLSLSLFLFDFSAQKKQA